MLASFALKLRVRVWVRVRVRVLLVLLVGVCYMPRGVGALPIMAYTRRLHPKGVPFPGFRYMKG